MSSAISTDRSTFRPWHFFVLSALLAATAGVLMSRDTSPEHIILLSAAILAGGLAGLAFHRTVWPLLADDAGGEIATLSEGARAVLQREKRLVLRSIKELEFDHAMGKVARPDFEEMAGRLRVRALALMKQLDETPTYRELIEGEVAGRLKRRGTPPAPRPAPVAAVRIAPGAHACPGCGTVNDADGRFCKSCGTKLPVANACGGCGTVNDDDARFCKACGTKLETAR